MKGHNVLQNPHNFLNTFSLHDCCSVIHPNLCCSFTTSQTLRHDFYVVSLESKKKKRVIFSFPAFYTKQLKLQNRKEGLVLIPGLTNNMITLNLIPTHFFYSACVSSLQDLPKPVNVLQIVSGPPCTAPLNMQMHFKQLSSTLADSRSICGMSMCCYSLA